MKQQNGFLKALKVLLVVAAVGFAIVKIYQKFFKNKSTDMLEDIDEWDETDLLEGADETAVEAEIAAIEAELLAEESSENEAEAADADTDAVEADETVDAAEDDACEAEETLEVSADDVIDNAEDME